LIVALVICNSLYSQTKVSGIILDSDTKEIILGATILEQGTENGTISDIDGKYELTVGESAVLVVSYLGYGVQEILVDNRTEINIELSSDAVTLDGVVITAFGIEKNKRTLGFAQTNIDGEELLQAKEVNSYWK